MAVSHVQDDSVARDLHAITHAHQFQCLGISVGDSDHRVGDEASSQAMKSVVEFTLAEPLDHDLALLHLDHHVRVIALRESSARP